MKKRVAINGFGRIGRLVFRQLFDAKNVEVVAVNDPGDIKQTAHLLEFDSSQGIWKKDKIKVVDNKLVVDNKEFVVVAQRDPLKLPWKDLNIDIVIEGTGVFREKEKAMLHVEAGAKKVIISAPGSGEMKTIVFGVNDNDLTGEEVVLSGASCTTNCLAPIVHALDQEFKLVKGFMTTVHSYTNDQKILDASHKDIRRARAAAVNIIPTTTGAAIAVGKVLPHLNGKLDGIAMRVPTITGSVVDLVCELEAKVSVKEVNDAFKKHASPSFEYSEKELVSSDYIGATAGSILDAKMTKVMDTDSGQLVKVLAWYDNEMSYVAQLVRTIEKFATLF